MLEEALSAAHTLALDKASRLPLGEKLLQQQVKIRVDLRSEANRGVDT